MPISPIVLQRRHAELGRIRLGAKRGGNGAPMKLASFRFTSPSEGYIRDLAELYGGEAKPWDNNGKAEFEVFTEATSIPVIAVKGGLSQWMETWSGGGVTHRCDGERGVDGTHCNPDDPNHLNAKPTTRLSVMLPELEAIGVFRMESHGWNAAAEIPAVAELAQFVGDLVPANLHMVERRSIKDGKTSRFVVPVLDLQIGTARLKEIVAQKSGMAEVQSTIAGPGERLAIEAGGSDPYVPLFEEVDGATTLDELAGIWDGAREQHLVGSSATVTPRHDEFVAAWKAKAHAIKAAEQPPTDAPAAAAGQPVGADDGDDDARAFAVWNEVLAAAGSLEPPMTLPDVEDDFVQRFGMASSAASVAELEHYRDELKGLVTA